MHTHTHTHESLDFDQGGVVDLQIANKKVKPAQLDHIDRQINKETERERDSNTNTHTHTHASLDFD
jgi:hypothetical protein